MKQFAKIMLIVLSLSGLAAVLSSVPTRRAGAATTADETVRVVNTPLPVQGSVSVNNFPTTQNVAITGTPTVNVATLPTLSFPSSLATDVTRDEENPARHPFQTTLCVTSPSASSVCSLGSSSYNVGATEELVIDFVDGGCLTDAVSSESGLALVTIAGGARVGHLLGINTDIGSSQRVQFVTETRIYADPSTVVLVRTDFGGGGFANCQVSLSGHFVTVP